jgi:flagellar biosynthesis component FlhA
MPQAYPTQKEKQRRTNKQTNTNYVQKERRAQEVNYQKKRCEPSKHKNAIHLTVSTSLHPAGCQHDTNLCHRITTPWVSRAR